MTHEKLFRVRMVWLGKENSSSTYMRDMNQKKAAENGGLHQFVLRNVAFCVYYSSLLRTMHIFILQKD